MEIPFEIGQKVYLIAYDNVRDVTIKQIIVDENNEIHLVTDYDTVLAKCVYTDPHEAFFDLRDITIKRFQNLLEYIDKAEESYLNFQQSNEQK